MMLTWTIITCMIVILLCSKILPSMSKMLHIQGRNLNIINPSNQSQTISTKKYNSLHNHNLKQNPNQKSSIKSIHQKTKPIKKIKTFPLFKKELKLTKLKNNKRKENNGLFHHFHTVSLCRKKNFCKNHKSLYQINNKFTNTIQDNHCLNPFNQVQPNHSAPDHIVWR